MCVICGWSVWPFSYSCVFCFLGMLVIYVWRTYSVYVLVCLFLFIISLVFLLLLLLGVVLFGFFILLCMYFWARPVGRAHIILCKFLLCFFWYVFWCLLVSILFNFMCRGGVGMLCLFVVLVLCVFGCVIFVFVCLLVVVFV